MVGGTVSDAVSRAWACGLAGRVAGTKPGPSQARDRARDPRRGE